jgi:hypothetical protein
MGLRPGSRLLTPAYLCQAVLHALRAEEIVPVFYGVDTKFDLEIDSARCGAADGVLIADYFGVKTRQYEGLSRLVLSGGQPVLRDISHSLLAPLERSQEEGCVYIASLRKTLPIPDGGLVLGKGDLSALADSIAESDCPHAVLRASAMLIKAIYLVHPELSELPFRERFVESEHLLDGSQVIGGISTVSRNLLPFLKAEALSSARRRNFIQLLELSRGWPTNVAPVFDTLAAEDVPLGFPVLSLGRDSLRAFLIDHRIYPPVHWPLDEGASRAYPLSRNISRRILTLPCDHRYGAEDMRLVSSAIVEWGNSHGEFGSTADR